MKAHSKRKITTYLNFKKFYLILPSIFTLTTLTSSISTSYNSNTQEESLRKEIIESNTETEKTLKNLERAIELTDYGNYKEASNYYQILDTSAVIQSNDSLRMVMLESRSFMNKVLQRFSKSLEDLLAMLDYYTKQNDMNNIAKTETLLAEFYRARNLKELAFKHLGYAEEIIAQGGVDPCNIAYWFSRRAACETQFQPNTDNIVFFCNKALEITNTECSSYTEALIYNELGFTYGHTEFDNEEKVISYYKKALEILEESNRMRDVATVIHNLTTYYARRGYFDKALEEAAPIIELAETNNWHGVLEDLYLLKMTILNGLGRYKEAYDLSRKSYLSKVQLMNDQYAIDVEELQAVHDKELAEKALKEVQIKAEANERALAYTVVSSVLLGASTLTVVLLFLRVRRKNQQLNLQQAAIESTNEQLSHSLEEKELLYRELNHRVKNNLMVLSGLIYLQQEEDPDGNNELYTALRNRIQTMAIVHEKLYGINSSKNINFQDYLVELVPLVFNSLKKGNGHMPFTIRCKALFLPIDKAIPLALIFNELITNSIKHSTPQSLEKGIVIQCRKENNLTIIEYSDFGPGIKGSGQSGATGSMGMRIIKLMVMQLKATLKRLPTHEGLSFEIRF